MKNLKTFPLILNSILFFLFIFSTSCKKMIPDVAAVDPESPVYNNISPVFYTDEMPTQQPEPMSTDTSVLRVWEWQNITIPSYTYPDATAFGNGLFVDVAFDTLGVFIDGEFMCFHLNPETPTTPDSSISPNNYRSEIHTTPWEIRHPLGTEQWIGWRYIFGENYVIDPTAPITIFQNHPGVIGMSPAIELEIAYEGQIAGALGGEIQIINAPNNDRILTDFRPEAGDTLDIVIQVIHDLGENGWFRVWLNQELVFEQNASTVYEDYAWGGNNKWGIYHHFFNNAPAEVASSLATGAGVVDIKMGSLRLLTRSKDHFEYQTNAYPLVDSQQ